MKRKIAVIFLIIIFLINLSFSYAIEVPTKSSTFKQITDYVNSQTQKPATYSASYWKDIYDRLMEFYEQKNWQSSLSPTANEVLTAADKLSDWKSSNGSTSEQTEDEKKNSVGGDITNSIEEGNEKRANSKMNSATGEERNKTVFNDDVLKDISKYDPSQDPMDNNSSTRIENATSKILTVISNIGIAVAVIMLAVLGIKYMLGSIEEKAEYKEGMIPYVIGAFILFGITSFVKILMAIGDKIGNLS